MIVNFVLLLIFATSSFATDSIRVAPISCFNCQNVEDPRFCNTITTCLQDQVCSVASSTQSSGITTYTLGCAKKHPCVDATRFRLQHDTLVTVIGKRFSTSFPFCSVCCGDSLCNKWQCMQLTKILTQLWKSGHLNLDTLTYKL